MGTKTDALASVEDAAAFGAKGKEENLEVQGTVGEIIEHAPFDVLMSRIQNIDKTLETVKIEIDGDMLTISQAGKRKEILRGALKKSMGSLEKQLVKDETTMTTATLRSSYSDVWDLDKLREFLKPKQRKIVIVPSIDHHVLAKLIETGAISRARMEVDGIVTKKLRSVGLYIRDTKEDDE